ncbi:MAG: glycoside hydrolase family 32 protein [Anaerolineae bacterium]
MFKRLFVLGGLFLILLGCADIPELSSPESQPAILPQEPALRVERFHFTPPFGWMNDPNGLVYYAGEYHLFYQYHPDGLTWGPMHWGHALSPNLLEWEHLPIALAPDDLGTIFSGSAVVDWENTAGFGEEALVAIFTHFKSPTQMQSLAYSTDQGRTWTKYAGNPVLKPPNGIRNFRDPKVFWFESEDGQTEHWVMALAAGSVILFYTSPDLIHWESSGGFGITEGATCGVWETPDLFELPLDDGGETRWVLTVGINNCAPAGGSGTQYFVGEFDGFDFTNENDKKTVLWADYGADFYAGQSWSDTPDGRRIMLGWMNNWTYAQDIPTGGADGKEWRGQMTVPRKLGLTQTADGIRLTQNPIGEMALLRSEPIELGETPIPSNDVVDTGIEMVQGEIIAEFEIDDINQANQVGVKVRVGDGEETLIGYALKARKVFVTRKQSGETEFSDLFTPGASAPYNLPGNTIKFHILIDRESIEVFVDDGRLVLTELIFPAESSSGIELFAEGGEGKLTSLTANRFATAESAD